MKNIDPRKLDPNTRKQLEQIEKDKDIKAIKASVKDLTERIYELEQARQVQIRLNEQFRQAIGKMNQSLLQPEEKESLWEKVLGFLTTKK